jgi:hypothetical protein
MKKITSEARKTVSTATSNPTRAMRRLMHCPIVLGALHSCASGGMDMTPSLLGCDAGFLGADRHSIGQKEAARQAESGIVADQEPDFVLGERVRHRAADQPIAFGLRLGAGHSPQQQASSPFGCFGQFDGE